MRFEPVRLMSLAICLGLVAGSARGQDDGSAAEFDDNFGEPPPPEELAPAAESAAPAVVAGAQDSAGPAAPASDDDGLDFVHNAVEGLTGGVHAVDARSGRPQSF